MARYFDFQYHFNHSILYAALLDIYALSSYLLQANEESMPPKPLLMIQILFNQGCELLIDIYYMKSMLPSKWKILDK